MTNICAVFSEELKSSPKGCPCSGKLNSVKKPNQPHLDINVSLLGPVLYYLEICYKRGRNHLQYENYQNVNDHLSGTTGEKHQPRSPQRLKDYLHVLDNTEEGQIPCE